MTGKEMVALFRSKGWTIDRIHGSHYVMKKNRQVEVIPVHRHKELAKGLEAKLKKRLDIEERR